MLCNFIEITLQQGCFPVNLLRIFRTSFPKKTSGRLSLRFRTNTLLMIHYSLFIRESLICSGWWPWQRYWKFPVLIKWYFRSSRPEVFRKKGALRNFAKFTEKHLCQSLFFNEIDSPDVWLIASQKWHGHTTKLNLSSHSWCKCFL